MQINYQVLILKILEAINYTGDKEKFVKDFVTNTQLQTFAALAETLSPEKQKKLAEDTVSVQEDQEKALNILKEYFTEEQIQKAFEEAGIGEIKGLLESVKNTLNEEQKQSVVSLFKETSPTNNT